MSGEARFSKSYTVPQSEEWLIKEVARIAQLDGISESELIRLALKEYVEKHKKGNPQKMLIPHQPKIWEAPPVEKRYENLQWLISLVDRNAGKMNQLQLVAQFSSASGLKRETVQEYVRTLLLAKKLYVKEGKVYASLQGGE